MGYRKRERREMSYKDSGPDMDPVVSWIGMLQKVLDLGNTVEELQTDQTKDVVMVILNCQLGTITVRDWLD